MHICISIRRRIQVPSLLTVALVAFAVIPRVLAQSNGNGAERSWQALQDHLIPAIAKRLQRTTPRSSQEQTQERAELVAHFSSLANEAKAFRDAYPDDKNAKASLAIEARSLLKVAFLGDNSQASRTDALVTQIEADASLPSAVRFEIVALSEHILLRQAAKTAPEARAAREASARYLIKEFPGESGGYLRLLSVADASGDKAKLAAVAQEIEESGAPFPAKAAARVATARYALIGKSLANVANTALGRNNFFEQTRKHRTVLYAWASWSPNSIAFAKNALSRLPKDVLVIGYNLDRDVAVAKRIAQTENLPGEQYYDSGGLGSWLSILLSITTVPTVYLTDDNGIVTDIAGQRRDLVALLGKGKGN